MVYLISLIFLEFLSMVSSKTSSSVNKFNSYLVCASLRRQVAPSTKRLNAIMLFLSRIKIPFWDPSLFRPVRNSMIWERIRKSPFWLARAYLLESGSNTIAIQLLLSAWAFWPIAIA